MPPKSLPYIYRVFRFEYYQYSEKGWGLQRMIIAQNSWAFSMWNIFVSFCIKDGKASPCHPTSLCLGCFIDYFVLLLHWFPKVVPKVSGCSLIFLFVYVPLASLSILSIVFISLFQILQSLYLNYSPALQIPHKSTRYDLTPFIYLNLTVAMSMVPWVCFLLYNQFLLHLCFFCAPNVDVVQNFSIFL